MFKSDRSPNCTRMDQKNILGAKAVGLLVLVFSLSIALPGAVFVPEAQAKKKTVKVKKSKKFTKAKRAKRLQKKRRIRKKVRRTRSIKITPAVSTLLRTQNTYKAKLNLNTVTLMTGCCTTGAYTAFGADIKDMVKQSGDKSGLRVLPTLGSGAGGNVRDILYLRGIDMAILNTDVIDYYKGKPLFENLNQRIHYITKLFNEEVHLYGGAGVASLHDLNGKRVGYNNSSAEVTGAILFKKLGIKPLETQRISEGDGALALKEGRIDAMMRVTGKPIRNSDKLKAIFPQIKLLPINYDPAFIGSHLPTQLTYEDYPELIDEGQVVPTIAIRTILAVFNWKPKSERYRRLEKFTRTFFDNFSDLRGSRNLHSKWAEVNLQATVPGMTRFAPAQDWIKSKNKIAIRSSGEREGNKKKDLNEDLMKNFKLFLASKGGQKSAAANKGDTEKLLSDFLGWQKRQR